MDGVREAGKRQFMRVISITTLLAIHQLSMVSIVSLLENKASSKSIVLLRNVYG